MQFFFVLNVNTLFAKGNYPFSTSDKLFFNNQVLMRRKISHCPVGLETTTSQPHAEYWNFYVTAMRHCRWDTGFDDTGIFLPKLNK